MAPSRIMDGMGRGEPTATGGPLAGCVVESALKAIEVLDLDQRLAALEERTSHASHIRKSRGIGQDSSTPTSSNA
jgi:hypothetical protein